MPNDPRVKFKKKHYDLSHNIIHFGGGGSGGRSRSLFEEGNLPRPPGGGEPPTQIDIPTYRNIESIPQPLKPGLNPGEITGITIGALAGLGTLEVARRAYLEYLEEQKLRRGMRPVSQDDRPLSSRQSGGQRLERPSRTRVGRSISRGINNAIQSSFEMVTPSSTYRPIPIQSEIVLPSGATTPRTAPAPTNYEGRVTERGLVRWKEQNIVMRDPQHSSISKALDTDPNRLSTIFTSPEGTIGEIKASSITKPAPPIRKPDVILDLQNELEKKQLELNIERARIVPDDRYFNLVDEYAPHRLPREGISEGRINKLKAEIKVLERKIKSRGIPAEASETSRRILNMALEERAAIESAGGVGIGSGTRAETELSRQGLADRIDQLNREQFVRDVAKSERIAQESVALENRLIARQAERNRNYNELLIDITPEMRARFKSTSIFDINDPNNIDTMTDAQFEAFMERSGINYKRTPGDVTPEIDRFNLLEGEIENIEVKLMDRQLPIARRAELVAQEKELRATLAFEQEVFKRAKDKVDLKAAVEKINIPKETPASRTSRRISKKIAPETPIANNLINDRINAARQTQGTEMMETGLKANTPLVESTATTIEVKTRGPTIFEQTRTAIQKMTTRKPIEDIFSELPKAQPKTPVPSNQASLERARAAKIEELAFDAEMARLQKRLNEVRNATGPIENIPEGTEIQALREQPIEPIVKEMGQRPAQNSIAEFNDFFDTLMNNATEVGFEIPKAPAHIEAQGELAVKKYQYEEALEFIEGKEIYLSEIAMVKGERKTTGKARSKKRQLRELEELYQKAVIQENANQRRTPGTATAERARAPAVERATAPATATAERARAVETARAAAPETTPEISARAAAAPAPEAMSARRQLSAVPELTASRPEKGTTLQPQETAPPGEGASFAERQAFFEKASRVAPPPGEPAPSAPPSAPGTETATPQEGIVTERTPAERAAFAEEVSAGLKGKKPGRQKVKINVGKTNKATANPLEKFVSPQFRNTPNTEIHPSAKNLRGALSELSARVPKLVPSKKVLISVGSNLASEGGGMVAGFYAGSEAGKAMSNYFATHPPKNRGEEYGQALATSMVALGVGNLVSKAVTYAIRQGVRIAMGAQISGSISGAGTAGFSAVAEAALFATVATTTQFYVTKTLEDAGRSHAYSRTMGSIAATEALVYTDMAMWLAKGGPFNPAGDLSFLASEVFIIGFGIYSAFEEYFEGRQQDIEGEAYEAEARAEREKAEQDRRDAINALNTTNNAKATFLRRLPNYNYDFDALYERLTEQEKTDLGITDPETKLAFQRQVERTFDPFGEQSSSSGLTEQPVLTQLERDRAEVMNNYINYHIRDLQGQQQPPFNFDDPKVRELNEYSGGTWLSAAKVSASTNYLQAQQVYPLISKAQNEIIDAFHNERKTIEQMDPLTVRYATLDSTFRENYEAYIVTDAAAQILMEFNRTQYTYNDVDPALLAIADRDPNFRGAADAYYQVLANQARDYNLSISEVARLNSLMENEQAIEIGKLNEARNAIINKNQAENQAMVDAYNANILREINIYGDNFDAIIRNINDQSLLSGHTFLYATNRADLYRQLHLEVPEVELVDPDDEVDRPDATWHPGKGRKVGDTAVYGYRYNLTDEQNQEIEDLISANKISRFDAEKQALVIYNRDRAKFVQTDQEKASDLGLTLDAYYEKFGIVEPTIIVSEPTYSDLQKMYPTQYRDLQQKYKNDPDADKKIEETLARGHKRRMEETGGVFTPMEQEDLTVEQLQQMYPSEYTQYTNLFTNNGKTPLTEETIKGIEIMLREAHRAATNAGTAPPVPTEPTRDPTYEELQVMYPEQFDIYNDANSAIGQEDKTEMMLRRLHTRRTAAGTAPNIPGLGEVTPVNNELKNGVVNMPDGSTRIYKNGLVVNVMYPLGIELSKAKNAQEINAVEGQQNADYTPTTGPATTLRQGAVTMPDGSKRFYVDGKVVSVDYPEGMTGPTIKEINAAEGTNSVPINQATNPGGLPTQIETPTGGTLPFVPGTKSFEYADSGTQAKPTTQRPGLDVVPEFTSGSRSHEYMNPAPSAATPAPATTTNP